MNLKAPIAWGLVAVLGGLAILIATVPTTAQPAPSVAPATHAKVASLKMGYRGGDNTPGAVNDGGILAGAPEGAPGPTCHYDNLRLSDAGIPILHAQKSGLSPANAPFYSEVADDFLLFDQNDPAGLNGCVLDRVQFAVTHDTPGISPQNWNGVKITIYQDRGNVCVGQALDFPCQRNPGKGPGGYPVANNDATDREHRSCCANPDKAAIVCELKVPMSKVTFNAIPGADDSYDITVSGLMQYNCVLEKNKKYWIAPVPEMEFFDTANGAVQGATYLWSSTNSLGREAQAYSPDFTGVDQWSGIATQLGWFDTDLYLGIWADKETPPDEPCHYENLRLGEPGLQFAYAQKSGGSPVNQPIYAETADDFVLFDPDDPNGGNGCMLDQVQFAVTHDTPGISPQNWNGVKITIYQDRGNVCQGQAMDPPCLRNPDKGPGGYPIAVDDPTNREHRSCCANPDKAAIVCELKIPMSKVSFTPILQYPDTYDITVFGLKQYNCLLEKNKKYWIAPTPEMEFFDPGTGTVQGATYLVGSTNPVGNEAQVIADASGIQQWSGIQTQLGWFHSDLYLAIWANKADTPDEPCHYENLRVGQDVWAAQKAVDFPFYAETADDFILSDPNDPNGDNACRLDQVTFAVWHEVPGTTPAFWDGIKITIYQDRGTVCLGQPLAIPCSRNPDKGPAGYAVPAAGGARIHQPCCMAPDKPAIVCELKIPMSKATWVAIPHPIYDDLYEITVSGLDQYACLLEKNKKYWIAPAPEVQLSVAGQTFLLTSPNPSGQEAQLLFPEGNVPAWSLISTQLGGFEHDLYLAIWATKADDPVVPCQYENLRKSVMPDPPPFFSHSQKSHDTSVPLFYAETADDFVLTDPDDPQGDNNCRLDEVEFSVWHNTPGISPANWDGVKITIYQDRGVVCVGQPLLPPCSLNPDKGPAGFPTVNTDPTVREHESCCSSPDKDAIVCELKIPMSDVIWTPQIELPDLYHILVPNLAPQLCHLTKGKKYWIAPAPVMDFTDTAGNLQGFTFLMTSPNPADHSAQVVSDPLLGHPFWESLSNLPVIDSDLFLAVRGIKTAECPWDCADGDRIVGINDFLALLGQWNIVNAPCDFNGGGVDIVDFLKLLAHWGPCP